MKKRIQHNNKKNISPIKATKEIEWTNSGKLKLLLVFSGIILFFVFFTKNGIEDREKEYNLVKSDYKITKGIITKMFVYKGKTIRVKFKINDKTYIGSDGMFERKNKNVGDSIFLKYYAKDPSLFITELNKNY